MDMNEAKTANMLWLKWFEFDRNYEKVVEREEFYNKLAYFSKFTSVRDEQEKRKFNQLLSIFKNPSVNEIMINKEENRKNKAFSIKYLENGEIKTFAINRMCNNFCDGLLRNGIIALINETCSDARSVVKYADYDFCYIYKPKKPYIIP